MDGFAWQLCTELVVLPIKCRYREVQATTVPSPQTTKLCFCDSSSQHSTDQITQRVSETPDILAPLTQKRLVHTTKQIQKQLPSEHHL
eukprot:5230786-Amphidinium_carterae.1